MAKQPCFDKGSPGTPGPAGLAAFHAAVADVTAYVAAIGLASVAALFPIRGMVALFSGAPVLIIAMACTMEARSVDRCSIEISNADCFRSTSSGAIQALSRLEILLSRG